MRDLIIPHPLPLSSRRSRRWDEEEAPEMSGSLYDLPPQKKFSPKCDKMRQLSEIALRLRTRRDNVEVIRLISARSANRKEQKLYERGISK